MIKPIGKRVLIETDISEKQSEMGLDLSDSKKAMTPIRGKVMAVGDVADIKVGDTIFFRRYSLDELIWTNKGVEEKIYLVDSEDILAVDDTE